MSLSIKDILSRLVRVRRSGKDWIARCPAHQDKKPSLSIRQVENKILLHCHAGCSVESICAALGITVRELSSRASSRPRVVAQYDYRDETGVLLFQVVRYTPKTFKQRRPAGSGKWTWNLKGVRRVLYRLPDVLKAQAVLICEGEKDCETAYKLGLVATCNPGGAGKWRHEFGEALVGKVVTIIADADDPGRKHAQQVAALLDGVADAVKVIDLPQAKDLTEWIERGGTRGALLELATNSHSRNQPPISSAAMLNAVVAYICRFVSLSDAQVRVTALWVAHTHVFSSAYATPYLAITSAEKQSGKTRLLEVLEIVVAKPWLTGRVTPAVLTRKIDKEKPTLLLDESDAAFGGEKEYAEALRGVLNTGHRSGGKASCCTGQGQNISFQDFSTFCPKAIAGIGQLPDTVADRSIPIRLKRAAHGETLERFRRRDVEPEAARLREELQLWSKEANSQLREARPELPEKLTDRQLDGAEPLLAIADAAGGEWPHQARSALEEILIGVSDIDDSVGVRLLRDIQIIFQSKDVKKLPSLDLAKELVAIETSQWSEFDRGRPITPTGIARILKRYDIAPRTIKLPDGSSLKGYQSDWFEDSFSRYLRPKAGIEPSPSSPFNVFAGQEPLCETSPGTKVTFPKNEDLSANTRLVTMVTRDEPLQEREPVSSWILRLEPALDKLRELGRMPVAVLSYKLFAVQDVPQRRQTGFGSAAG
jgi:hypothetical protein